MSRSFFICFGENAFVCTSVLIMCKNLLPPNLVLEGSNQNNFYYLYLFELLFLHDRIFKIFNQHKKPNFFFREKLATMNRLNHVNALIRCSNYVCTLISKPLPSFFAHILRKKRIFINSMVLIKNLKK